MKLENDTWYWASRAEEGDIFYPFYVNESGDVVMDGDKCDISNDLIINKAIMPNNTE